MKKFVLPIVAMAMILLLGSCRTSKQIPYFQNADSISFAASRGLYDARIMPKDLLSELFFLALAFELKKLWMKRENGRLQTHLSQLKAA